MAHILLKMIARGPHAPKPRMSGAARPWRAVLVFCAGLLGAHPLAAQGTDHQVVLATGGPGGVYLPLGEAICAQMKRREKIHNVTCAVRESGGSIANIEQLRSGAANFAIVQADILYYALNGFGPFKDSGPLPGLRTVGALHEEVFTVLARRDAAIATFDDLKGKRVHIGHPGSGHRGALDLLLHLKGWTLDDFATVEDGPVADQVAALCAGRLEAIVYTVGHPNAVLQRAAEQCDTRLVRVFGREVRGLIEKFPFLSESFVRGKHYPGSPPRTRSFGVRAVLVTRAGVSEDLVHAVTATLFNTVTDLKGVHPALSGLTAAGLIDTVPAPPHAGMVRFIESSTDLYSQR